MPNERPAESRSIVRAVQSTPVRRRSMWPKAAALALVGAILAAASVQWAAAQRRDAPRINVAPTIVAEPDSQTPLQIEVGPPNVLPSNSFLRLRAFPRRLALTGGTGQPR